MKRILSVIGVGVLMSAAFSDTFAADVLEDKGNWGLKVVDNDSPVCVDSLDSLETPIWTGLCIEGVPTGEGVVMDVGATSEGSWVFRRICG